MTAISNGEYVPREVLDGFYERVTDLVPGASGGPVEVSLADGTEFDAERLVAPLLSGETDLGIPTHELIIGRLSLPTSITANASTRGPTGANRLDVTLASRRSDRVSLTVGLWHDGNQGLPEGPYSHLTTAINWPEGGQIVRHWDPVSRLRRTNFATSLNGEKPLNSTDPLNIPFALVRAFSDLLFRAP